MSCDRTTTTYCAGKGCVFSFDPVGSYEREVYRAGGSAASMLQPLLDNQVRLTCPSPHPTPPPCRTQGASEHWSLFAPRTDWLQEPKCGRAATAHSGEGCVPGQGCVHCCCREGHLHWGWSGGPHHHRDGHRGDQCATEKGLDRTCVRVCDVFTARSAQLFSQLHLYTYLETLHDCGQEWD